MRVKMRQPRDRRRGTATGASASTRRRGERACRGCPAARDQCHEEQCPVRDLLQLVDAFELALVLREESQHTVAPPAPGQPESPIEFGHADEARDDDQPQRDLTDPGIGGGRDDRGLRTVDEFLDDRGIDEHPRSQRHEAEVDERDADDDEQQQLVKTLSFALPGFDRRPRILLGLRLGTSSGIGAGGRLGGVGRRR